VSRIVMLADTQRLGGGEGMLVEMARAAAGGGHEVIVMAPQQWLLDHVRAQVPGVRVEVVGRDFLAEKGRRARFRVLAAGLPDLARALRRLRPDVLHVSNGGHPGSLLCCLALPLARLLGIRRRVYSVHAVPRPRGTVNVAFERLLDPLVWRSTDAVAVASVFTGDQLRDLRGMPDRLRRTVPNAVPEPAVPAGTRAKGPGLVAGMIAASADLQKGHAVLIEALGQTPGTVTAVVAGSALPDAAAERARELGLGSRLEQLGRVDDVGAFLAGLDLLVVPPVADESIPLVIPEAMAAGLPVIASRLSGIPEAVEDGRTGRLFPPGDAAALAELLTAAAAGELPLAEWGRRGRERWSERFSLEALRAATLPLYEPEPDRRSTVSR
jgi:glycosyltransferase involved in cell wall biosynthesis